MKRKIIILLSLFVILTICVLLDITGAMDYNIYNVLSTSNVEFLTVCSNVVTSLASSQAIIIITLILIFLLNTNHQRIFVIINTLISAGIIILSKNIFLRERPLIGSEILSSYSFPSGHSLIATTYYGFLIYLLRRSKCKEECKVIGTTFLTTLIVLICLSRLILNVHYLTDVVGGVILGLVILLVLIYFFEATFKPKEKEKPLLKTLSYGFNGILYTLKHERNMVIHFLVMILVIIAGIVFKITFVEWGVCFVLFALVLSLELMNTALENVVDLVTEEKKAKAKVAKDAAAGAVLVAAIFAVIIGISIFLPRLLEL
ncbi:MAG TPA: diacylglycerol kinase [Candidatus Onthousia excrementipullorum]|uniref:Diacylglycerol kinase n=1 Tax=Candidatus Onthousia excrementipullorum TaxID=2840884 RepID=A0A9D1J3X5_9FIRM|nr:diacylglycerol kinase [Candidatus Onthousia excrementipullorum]